MRNWHWNWLERKPEDADKGGDYGLYKRNITRTSRYPLAGIPAKSVKMLRKSPRNSESTRLCHRDAGQFQRIHRQSKSKKTFNVSAIVAAALKNSTVLRYAAELPEEKRKVLYIDTEQSPYHCLKVMKRILRMAGLPDDRDSGYLEFLALRKYTPEQRISIVEQAIYHSPDIGLVIIDGIRDMVYDINSPGESTRIISKLMQWTDDRQIHIHTILHQNKGDENARGTSVRN